MHAPPLTRTTTSHLTMPSTEDDKQTEAGPSNVVVFKKRASGRAKVKTGIKSFAADDDVSAPITSLPNRTAADDDEEGPTLSVEDLVALRALRNKPQGIDLNRLNNGEVKKKKKKKAAAAGAAGGAQQTEEERWAEQMQRGGLVTRDARKATQAQHKVDDDDDDSDSEEGEQKTKSGGPRLIKENNFQGETGTVDVDKHMMAYIEEEMQKRRRGEAADETVLAAAAANAANGDAASSRTAEDELYSIADKYQQIQQSAKEAIALARSQIHADGAPQATASNGDGDNDDDEEGNVALSTSMLTSVPEIDLGMEVRMRNIEATERARKAMEESQRNRHNEVNLDDADFAAARFFRPPNREPTEAERLRREVAQTLPDASTGAGSGQAGASGHYRKRQIATDDKVLDRFKKRQRDQLKR